MTNNYLPKDCIECGNSQSDVFDIMRCVKLEHKAISNPGERLPDCPLTVNKNLVTPQPEPVINDNPAVWDLVMKDIVQRDHNGYLKYGVRLQPFNGRDALIDAYQEALDLVVYLRQAIFERDGK